MWSPAVVTKVGGAKCTSAGVVIFVRKRLHVEKAKQVGVEHKDLQWEIAPSRLVACEVSIPGGVKINVYRVYLWCGIGWAPANRDIADKLGER